MLRLFSTLLNELNAGRGAVLCSILASSGSTPRGAGAKMLVLENGATLGTVGGGAVELHATELGKQALLERKSAVQGFILRPNDVADIGMICGGNVTVYLQYFDPGDAAARALIRDIVSLLQNGDTNAWLVLQLSGSTLVSMGIYDEARGLTHTDCLTDAELRPLLRSRAVLQKGDPAFYVEPLVRTGRVYVFGGGHVGRALVPVLASVGFRVTVFENRPAFAVPEAFPAAEQVILGDYRNIFEHVSLCPEDYVVIMTPGHQADYEVLEQALRQPTAYVGCIGSRHKVAATRARLLEAGLTEADVERVHSPIGLDIGGETPEEIAVSIAAEMIRVRARRAAR